MNITIEPLKELHIPFPMNYLHIGEFKFRLVYRLEWEKRFGAYREWVIHEDYACPLILALSSLNSKSWDITDLQSSLVRVRELCPEIQTPQDLLTVLIAFSENLKNVSSLYSEYLHRISH